MIGGWQTRRLGEVCERVTVGHVGITTTHYRDQGVLFLRTQNVGEHGLDLTDRKYITADFHAQIRKSQVRAGDILMSRVITHTVRCAQAPDDLGPANCANVVLVRPGGELSGHFLLHYIRSPQAQRYLLSRKVGSAQLVVNTTVVQDWPVPFPPLPEQRRIVAILDEAFEGIATAKANAEKNLQNARELAGALGEACFGQHIDDSFVSRDLASLCEFIVDCEHKTAPTQEHGYPSIRTPNVGKGKLILDDVNRVSEETYAAWTRRAVPLPGDLILAREAPAGNVAVIPRGVQVCLGQRTVLIRPRREVFEPEYLAHLLLQRSSQRRLLAHSRGATVQHVNMKDIRAFMITSVPSREVQLQVVDKLADIDQACESLAVAQRQKIASLDELKQSLLYRAFTGALTAKCAQKQVAEVA